MVSTEVDKYKTRIFHLPGVYKHYANSLRFSSLRFLLAAVYDVTRTC